jgi:kanamycin nucleotidyltransferase
MMEEPPLRRVNHEERLGIGEKICDKALERFGKDVLAVPIIGSTSKSLDRPYSDLEMDIIVKDGLEVPTKYYLHHGLLVQIDYKQESPFLKEVVKITREWPLWADECRNRIVLFEREGWTRKLSEAVKENDRADFAGALRFAALGMTESLATVRNADFKADLIDLRTRAFYLAWETAKLVYLLNRRYVLTTSWFWKQLFDCPEQPRDLRKLIDTLAGFTSSTREELVEASERLWKETMPLVRKHGISIDSSEVLV